VSIDEAPVTSRAAALKEAFDRSFAEPPRAGVADTLALLTLRAGGDSYAVKLADIAGLVVGRRIISLPTSAPDFLGVAGLRGSTVPVWSLPALLGYESLHESPRWLLLIGESMSSLSLGLAFEHFDGHLNVPRAALSERSARDGVSHSYVGESVRVADTLRGLLDIASLVDAVRRRVGLDQRQATQDG
jgi:purine-binding chemotaxis protein CheW